MANNISRKWMLKFFDRVSTPFQAMTSRVANILDNQGWFIVVTENKDEKKDPTSLEKKDEAPAASTVTVASVENKDKKETPSTDKKSAETTTTTATTTINLPSESKEPTRLQTIHWLDREGYMRATGVCVLIANVQHDENSKTSNWRLGSEHKGWGKDYLEIEKCVPKLKKMLPKNFNFRSQQKCPTMLVDSLMMAISGIMRFEHMEEFVMGPDDNDVCLLGIYKFKLLTGTEKFRSVPQQDLETVHNLLGSGCLQPELFIKDASIKKI